jgi:hypothetical protein
MNDRVKVLTVEAAAARWSSFSAKLPAARLPATDMAAGGRGADGARRGRGMASSTTSADGSGEIADDTICDANHKR